MKRTPKIVFGNAISVPDNAVVVILCSIELSGGRTMYETRYCELVARILIDGRAIMSKKFPIAAVGYEPHRSDLYEKIEKDGFSEDKRKELALFIFKLYEKGEVKSTAVKKKLEELLK